MQPSKTRVASRFTFVGEAPVGAEVYRQFAEPSKRVAVREPLIDLSSAPVWPEPTDVVDIVCEPDAGSITAIMQDWLRRPLDPTAVMTLSVETEAGKLRWRPSRAVIAAEERDCKNIIAGIVQFSFLEAQLRLLEQAVLPHQAAAASDVALVYQIKFAHRPHWDRLYRTMEELAELRLRFARLEPQMHKAPRNLPAESRRVIDRLSAKADIEARLEAVSNQLESCEDLYEGAIDRISDSKNYRTEIWLEVGIVALLVVEVVLLLLRR